MRIISIISIVSLLFVTDPVAAKKGGGGGEPTPVAISIRKNLDFGNVASSSISPGTVTLQATDGLKIVTGGVVDFGGKESLAEIRITGEKNAQVFVVLPSNVTVNASGQTMTLNNFTMDATNPIGLGNKGSVTILVGATLNLSVNQWVGGYSGTFPISADS